MKILKEGIICECDNCGKRLGGNTDMPDEVIVNDILRANGWTLVLKDGRTYCESCKPTTKSK